MQEDSLRKSLTECAGIPYEELSRNILGFLVKLS